MPNASKAPAAARFQAILERPGNSGPCPSSGSGVLGSRIGRAGIRAIRDHFDCPRIPELHRPLHTVRTWRACAAARRYRGRRPRQPRRLRLRRLIVPAAPAGSRSLRPSWRQGRRRGPETATSRWHASWPTGCCRCVVGLRIRWSWCRIGTVDRCSCLRRFLSGVATGGGAGPVSSTGVNVSESESLSELGEE